MSRNVPDEAGCLRLLREAGCKKRVVVHCCTVGAVAEEMLKNIDADRRLVMAGSLLHDIGRSVDNSIMHAIIGGEMIERLGLSEELVGIVRKHTGAGLDDIDAADMGLPPGDYMPRTIEEKVVAHADNLVSDDMVVCHTRSVEKLRNKGAIRGAERMESLHWELSGLYGMDLDVIPDIIGEYPRLRWVSR
ncbi:MAG: HDIG domain-containing protein [Methanomassiliicoccaceae archaeon]|nr:HDIG domain-containing protein [Methanomassiliicoccaceae archaeon]